MFAYTLLKSIDFIFQILIWLIIIRAFMSWIRPDYGNSLVQFVYRTTDPILNFFRDLIPTGGYSIDFSPIIAIFALEILQRIIHKLFVMLLF